MQIRLFIFSISSPESISGSAVHRRSRLNAQGIIDISVGLGPQTILMDSEEGMGDFRYLESSIDDGDFFNGSMLKDFTAHAGRYLVQPKPQALFN